MNTKIIPADVVIDQALVGELVAQHFNLSVHSISMLGEGWDNAVFLINHDLVFRFPRRKEAVPLIEMEMRLLPQLHGKVPVSIPHPIFIGQPSALFNRPFYGHELIPGSPGSAVSLTTHQYEHAAHDIGVFLKQLHRINPKSLGLSYNAKVPFHRTDFAVSLRKFKERLKAIESSYDLKSYQKKINHICKAASHFYPEKSMPVLVHGDLYHRHLIFNHHHQLTGAIDWGDAGLADPVADLGIVYQFLPASVHPIFFKAYGKVDHEALQYARFIGLYFAIALLWFGHDRNDQDLIKTSLRTLAQI